LREATAVVAIVQYVKKLVYSIVVLLQLCYTASVYGTACRLSVCRSVCDGCIAAKHAVGRSGKFYPRIIRHVSYT